MGILKICELIIAVHDKMTRTLEPGLARDMRGEECNLCGTEPINYTVATVRGEGGGGGSLVTAETVFMIILLITESPRPGTGPGPSSQQ